MNLSDRLERPNETMQRNFPVLLAVDPSVNNLGWAMYNMGAGGNCYDLKAWSYGLIQPYLVEKKDRKGIVKPMWRQHKWKHIYHELIKRLDGIQPTHFVSEWPTFMTGERGALAVQLDYTIDLAGIVGYLAGRLAIKPDWIALYTPLKWKGSVPKSVTETKFVRLFGEPASIALRRGMSNDTVDAIMIGEFWLTLYNQGKFSWMHQKIKTS